MTAGLRSRCLQKEHGDEAAAAVLQVVEAIPE
jgi:hypothetical protein